MSEILKKVRVKLTKEEMNSPKPIVIQLDVCDASDPNEFITYTIHYPKAQMVSKDNTQLS